MRLSKLFTKTRKEVPADEVSKNAQLLIRAGFISKEMAGVYSYLPLGKKVLDNIAKIVKEEMDAIGGQEILLTGLQPKELWEKSGRWDDKVVDVWFKTKLKAGGELGLGFTHEEPLTAIVKNYISSHNDLPQLIYQIQTKFRNELRSKSGLMRGREFLMKDLYSFSRSQTEHDKLFEEIKRAYIKIFKRLGIEDKTFYTAASGGSFTSEFSYEFQTITDSGEDTIYLDRSKNYAINEEVMNDKAIDKLGLNKKSLEKLVSAEVGNLFNLGTKYSDSFDLNYVDKDNKSKPVIMGSYGLGVSRVMGVIAEVLSDDNGLVWPREIAPAQVHLICLGEGDVAKQANHVYDSLTEAGIQVLYDDRNMNAGEKFADADLIGIPYRIVVSGKTIALNKVEVKSRTSSTTELLDIHKVIETFRSTV